MTAEPFRQDQDERLEPRDEVYHHTRATLVDQRSIPIIVVNMSPGGMMARTEAEIVAGEWLKVRLPGVGIVSAAVRWSLGGRVGCQFDRAIDPRDYRQLLAATAV